MCQQTFECFKTSAIVLEREKKCDCIKFAFEMFVHFNKQFEHLHVVYMRFRCGFIFQLC
jgi:hypothetical protein